MAVNPEVRALARRIAKLERQALIRKQPQLANSSIEDGALHANNADGDTTLIIGKQYDDTTAVAVITGPIPPTPSTPVVEPIMGGLKVVVSGEFANGSVIPMDFARWEIHASEDPEFIPDLATTLRSTVESPRGGQQSLFFPYTPHYVRVIARSTAGKASAPSGMVGPVQPRYVAQVDLDPAIELGGGSSDGLAPTAATTVTLIGGIGSLYFRWTEIANDDTVTYRLHVRAGELPTLDGTYEVAAGAGLTAAGVRSLRDGTKVVGDGSVIYYAIVTVEDADGVGPASDAVIGVPAQVTSADIAVNAITADLLTANDAFIDALQATDLTAVTLTGPTYRTSATGRRIVIRHDVNNGGMMQFYSGVPNETAAAAIMSGGSGTVSTLRAETGTTTGADDKAGVYLSSGTVSSDSNASRCSILARNIFMTAMATGLRFGADHNGFVFTTNLLGPGSAHDRVAFNTTSFVVTGGDVNLGGTTHLVAGNGSIGTGSFRTSVDNRIAALGYQTQSQVDARIAALAPTATAWQAVAVVGPYTAVSGFEPKIMRDIAGNVHLRGQINKNAAANGAPCLMLPVGFRPVDNNRQVIDTEPATTSSARLLIEPDGEVRPYLKTGAPTLFYLDSVFTTL